MHEGADKPHLFLHLYPPRTQREELCPLRDALDYAQCDSTYMESGCCDSARGASSYRISKPGKGKRRQRKRRSNAANSEKMKRKIRD